MLVIFILALQDFNLSCIVFQREALHQRVAQMLEVAAECGVNIACMQEAWSRYNYALTLPYFDSQY